MDQPEAQREYFDAQAARYDDYTAGDAWTANVYLADALARLRPDVRSALDLGAGTGQTLAVLRELFPRAELWGSDVSPAMLEQAAARVPTAQLEVRDLSAHARELDRRFDLITAIGCAELVADLPDVLPLLLTAVEPGGHLAVSIEPPVDALAVDLEEPATAPDGGPRRRYPWTAADVLGPLAGARLVASRLFRAYRRGDDEVLYELLVVQAPVR